MTVWGIWPFPIRGGELKTVNVNEERKKRKYFLKKKTVCGDLASHPFSVERTNSQRERKDKNKLGYS